MTTSAESPSALRAGQQLDDLPTGARNLATFAALAVRVQPELLRALRIRCAPSLDAGDEADLWSSDIVAARGLNGIVISAPVLRLLRDHLRARFLIDPDTVMRARRTVEEYHTWEPATFLVEEQIAWMAVNSDASTAATAEAELSRVLNSLIGEQRTGLADWWPAAWARLPDIGRSTSAAAQLNIATSPLLGPDAIITGSDGDVSIDDRLSTALRTVPDIQVGVVRENRMLEIGSTDPDAAAIAAPATQPVVLDIDWQDIDGSTRQQRIDVLAEPIRLEVGSGPVRIRTGRGVVFDIPASTARTLIAPLPPGQPRLGAHWDSSGTGFGLFSSVADSVRLCLFDDHGNEQQADMVQQSNGLWSCYLAGVGPGQRYGFRVTGPWNPSQGLRCNPAKLLLDPYAGAVAGEVDWVPAIYSHDQADENLLNVEDSAPHVPKSVVVNRNFDWTGDRRLRIPYRDTVIYEAHVKGLTALHPDVPPDQRGTYQAVAHRAVIDHLTRLGITAILLMPVQQFVQDSAVLARGLSDYWGYNTIGHFAPHNAYSGRGEFGQQVQEFKAMVKALHAAGIEVILDVAYGHTGEGDRLGPTLSLRGIDGNYYRAANDPRHYQEDTWTGNAVNIGHPQSLQLIMDSLRYWVTEMHVDGFRFANTPALARTENEFHRNSTFLQLVAQDPIVSQAKLIAEPQDVGSARAQQLGNFPAPWTELNRRFRDTVRDFWRGEPATIGDFATRLAGSADLFESSGRRPVASINFVTAHNGFTLADQVSYNEKRNAANGEENRDGTSRNRSWNCGVEGPTDDVDVLALRGRQQRNFLATLLLSQGVPMIQGGDEMGRTQQGNNNAWCQDNEISWTDWLGADEQLIEFAASVARLRRQHLTFRRRGFFDGRPVARAEGEPLPDIVWWASNGSLMRPEDWDAEGTRSIGMFLNGNGIRGMDVRGSREIDDPFLLLFNGADKPVDWILPPEEFAPAWRLLIDTVGLPDQQVIDGGGDVAVAGRTLVVLQGLAVEEPTPPARSRRRQKSAR